MYNAQRDYVGWRSRGRYGSVGTGIRGSRVGELDQALIGLLRDNPRTSAASLAGALIVARCHG
ncbi:MAG: hypothetical protein M3N97_01010 [Pseudomonadota bacterium]|nr:hypothetical protein [Pseudomonadota bacterium]